MKKILGIYNSPPMHWVGDGFPVRSLFSYTRYGNQISPFLLLDYAGPAEFMPTNERRGVGQHPHRGFETVTIVYQGEIAHRDSTGQGGIIGPGDVQWMTAGAGILHEEFHSPAFSRTGGTLHMIQLWVNLPAKYKMTAPSYQSLLKHDIPTVNLPGQAGTVRIIAGDYAEVKGPAQTFTPMHVWDMQLSAQSSSTLTLPAGWPTLLIVLHGTVQINRNENAHEAQMVLFEREGSQISLETKEHSRLLLLSGAPIDEPIAGYGPFVMNSQQEILQAITDFYKK